MRRTFNPYANRRYRAHKATWFRNYSRNLKSQNSRCHPRRFRAGCVFSGPLSYGSAVGSGTVGIARVLLARVCRRRGKGGRGEGGCGGSRGSKLEKGDVPIPRSATRRDPRVAPRSPPVRRYRGGGSEGRRERESKVDYIISPPLPGAHPPFCEC